ncbi:hypothetical protein XU18_1166 [Perkinsela sp. CCAP 1560/4]|nr:hypothetical protein XU18_2242 [Perkinsela sp. CCAP 1560/4]KNH08265.1 hypothetical protein XU18_1166 [Perkinsela sp. CCAP 1560/4]|eukprot:KNH06971.1 hypothetical protein XU18_2242 [Perkinsela sp. CCAP 1560/4]
MPFPYKLSTISQKIKSSLYGYTEWEEKADVATNVESWGPSTVQLSELASGTFHPTIRNEILRILMKKLKFRPTYWRQCHKSLVCLEYIIKNGDVSMVPLIKRYSQVIRYIAEHFYFTEGFEDRGRSVRAQANRVLSMLDNSQAIMKERAAAKTIRGKITGMGNSFEESHSPSEVDTSEIREFSTEQDIQEQQDYLLALKLQREEEKQSGRRLQDETFQRRASSQRSHPSFIQHGRNEYPSEYSSSPPISRNSSVSTGHNVYEDVSDFMPSATSRNHFSRDTSEKNPQDSPFEMTHTPEDHSHFHSPSQKQPLKNSVESSKSKQTKADEFDFSDLFSNIDIAHEDTKADATLKEDVKDSKADTKMHARTLDDLF